MFCSKCGNQLKDGDRFCAKCGASVLQQTEPQEKPAAEPVYSQVPVEGRAEVQTLVARIHATYHGNTIPAKSGAWYTPYIEYCMEHIDRQICGMAYMVDGGTMVADTLASRSYFAYFRLNHSHMFYCLYNISCS